MERFYSISKLKENIMVDNRHDDLSFVRIISVDSFADFIEINKSILGSCHHINLSKYCKSIDTIPFMANVHDAIDQINSDTVLLPLSEHLRINNSNINVELQRLLEKKFKEAAPNKRLRLYIPMYRMKEQLLSLIKYDKRFERQIFFLDKNENLSDDYSLTIISSNYDINVKRGKKIDGYQEYLKYWEDNPAQPIVLLSKMARFYKLKQYIDNVKVYTSAFEILSHLNIINDRIKESFANEDVWKQILDNCKGKSDIVKVISQKLKCTANELWDIYPSSSSFIDCHNHYRWILANSIELKGYAAMMIEKSNSSESFFNNLIMEIFNIDPSYKKFWQYYDERKRILSHLRVSILPSYYWEKLDTLKTEERVMYLTDNSLAEREMLLRTYSELKGIKSEILKIVYHNLYLYSLDFAFDNDVINDYFYKYKELKLLNYISDDFVELVDNYAKEKGKWFKLQLKNRNEIISTMYQGNCGLIWFDGLGVEYVAFIKEYIKINYPSVFCDIKIAYANIPTITDENKDFIENRNIIHINRELDKKKHITDYPSSLPIELDIIVNQIDTIMDQINSFDRILIVSDHGFTRLFKLANLPSLPVKETSEVKRYGRYCIDSLFNYGDKQKYSGCIDDNNFHCFANYNRFKCSMNLQGEVHGGATLEEVLVPIITLSSNEIESEISIESIKKEYSGKVGDVVRVIFKVNRLIRDELFADDFSCPSEDGKIFCFDYVLVKEESKSFCIKNNGKIIGRLFIRVNIQKGIKSNFDI